MLVSLICDVSLKTCIKGVFMATAQLQEKARWDETAKEDASRRILNGEASFEEMRRKLQVQSYQLDAWVGQYARKHWKEHKPKPPSNEEQKQAALACLVEIVAGRWPDAAAEDRLLEVIFSRRFGPEGHPGK